MPCTAGSSSFIFTLQAKKRKRPEHGHGYGHTGISVYPGVGYTGILGENRGIPGLGYTGFKIAVYNHAFDLLTPSWRWTCEFSQFSDIHYSNPFV